MSCRKSFPGASGNPLILIADETGRNDLKPFVLFHLLEVAILDASFVTFLNGWNLMKNNPLVTRSENTDKIITMGTDSRR